MVTASSADERSNGTEASEIEVLKDENRLLRLALAEAQDMLKATASGQSTTAETTSRSTSTIDALLCRSARSREPGNGGVAYAQMRRLLLKDTRFLRENFLPFFTMDDFGRLSGVCRRFKKSTYDLDTIVRCVESGGITDVSRGLMWLIMVGMDTVEPSSRGVLGVVVCKRTESPEEQYDRLHRAMNGTSNEASSPRPRSRRGSESTPPAADGDDDAEGQTAGTAAADGESVANGDRGDAGGSQRGKLDGEQNGTRVNGVRMNGSGSPSESGENNRSSRSRGDSGSSVGGAEGCYGSVMTDASLTGDASVGSESVLLWEDSDNGKGMTKSISTSPRLQLLLHANSAAQAAAQQQEADEQAASTAAAAAEAAKMAIAEAAEEADVAASDAEAAAGIRPLGGRRSRVVSGTETAEAVESIEEAAHAMNLAAGLSEAAANGEKYSSTAAAVGEAGPGSQAEKDGSRRRPAPVVTAATSGVVGWASGLFRKVPGANSPKSVASSAAAPNVWAHSPVVSRTASDGSQGHHRSSSLSGVTRMSSAGRLFGGLRYSLAAAAPKSSLPPHSPATSGASSSDPLSEKNTAEDHVCAAKKESSDTGAAAASGGKHKDRDKDKGKGNDGDSPIERVPGLYAALLMSADAMDANDMTGVRGPKQSCFVDIEKDLQRTLGMTDVTPLRNVLRCTSTFVPDVGYVQGMNFVCRSLLQVYRDEEEAFWVFVGMLQRFGMRKLYCPGMPLLRLRFFQLNRLLMWHLPDLHEHFEACGIQTNLYATSWFMTLLSDGGMLPDSQVKVVWDRIFLHSSSPASQWSPVFLFLLELLRRASKALKEESRFSELIQRLVNMPFRDLCGSRGASRTIEEARRRFETSSPMPVQLLLLHDQWTQLGEEEEDSTEKNDEKQLL